MQVPSLGREDPWRRNWQPRPVFLPEKSHGERHFTTYSWLNNNIRMNKETFVTHSGNDSFLLLLSVSILEYRHLPPSPQHQDLREWWKIFWFGENYNICYFYVTILSEEKKPLIKKAETATKTKWKPPNSTTGFCRLDNKVAENLLVDDSQLTRRNSISLCV